MLIILRHFSYACYCSRWGMRTATYLMGRQNPTWARLENTTTDTGISSFFCYWHLAWQWSYTISNSRFLNDLAVEHRKSSQPLIYKWFFVEKGPNFTLSKIKGKTCKGNNSSPGWHLEGSWYRFNSQLIHYMIYIKWNQYKFWE